MEGYSEGMESNAALRKEAYRRATSTPISVIARQLQKTLGQRLAALVVGAGDPKAIGHYANGTRSPHEDTARRLRVAHQVVVTLSSRETPETIQAWFVGMNPDLNDEAPADLILKEPKRVLEAARAYVEDG